MTLNRSVLPASTLIGLFAIGALPSAAGTAAPSSFELVFEGRHEAAAELRHTGSFTASSPFCSSGSATTLRVTGDATGTRLLTCADGSGSATALVVSIVGEHGGAGVWRIASGTGQYTSLRGRGTFRSTRTAGDPGDHASITFRSTWTGIADHDDTPPAIAISRASVTKLRRPAGSYVLRVAFSAREASGAVRYRIAISGKGAFLASRLGETPSGKASVAIRVRPAKHTRRLRIEITTSDPLGNETASSRDVTLPR